MRRRRFIAERTATGPPSAGCGPQWATTPCLPWAQAGMGSGFSLSAVPGTGRSMASRRSMNAMRDGGPRAFRDPGTATRLLRAGARMEIQEVDLSPYHRVSFRIFRATEDPVSLTNSPLCLAMLSA